MERSWFFVLNTDAYGVFQQLRDAFMHQFELCKLHKLFFILWTILISEHKKKARLRYWNAAKFSLSSTSHSRGEWWKTQFSKIRIRKNRIVALEPWRKSIFIIPTDHFRMQRRVKVPSKIFFGSVGKNLLLSLAVKGLRLWDFSRPNVYTTSRQKIKVHNESFLSGNFHRRCKLIYLLFIRFISQVILA